MEKIFYPDVVYNKKRRAKLIPLYVLLMLLPGGFGAYMFISGQAMFGILMLLVIVFVFAMIPSTLSQYPTKRVPMITVEGKSVTFGTSDTVKISDVISVSVVINVPPVGKIDEENQKHLKEVASVKPTEPVLGTCDVAVRNAKGKEVMKYNVVEDSIGALEALIEAGVRKYRITYCLKKWTEQAGYRLGSAADDDNKLSELTEKEKMMQLL